MIKSISESTLTEVAEIIIESKILTRPDGTYPTTWQELMGSGSLGELYLHMREWFPAALYELKRYDEYEEIKKLCE